MSDPTDDFSTICGERQAIQLFLRQKGYSAQSRTTNTYNAKLVPKPSTKNAYPHVNRQKSDHNHNHSNEQSQLTDP